MKVEHSTFPGTSRLRDDVKKTRLTNYQSSVMGYLHELGEDNLAAVLNATHVGVQDIEYAFRQLDGLVSSKWLVSSHDLSLGEPSKAGLAWDSDRHMWTFANCSIVPKLEVTELGYTESAK